MYYHQHLAQEAAKEHLETENQSITKPSLHTNILIFNIEINIKIVLFR